jgi:hypothetical protein
MVRLIDCSLKSALKDCELKAIVAVRPRNLFKDG